MSCDKHSTEYMSLSLDSSSDSSLDSSSGVTNQRLSFVLEEHPLYDYHIKGLIHDYMYEYNGLVIENYPEGNIEMKCFYISGEQEGWQISYTEHGHICQREWYIKGILHGHHFTYWGGELLKRERYQNNKLNGWSLEFYPRTKKNRRRRIREISYFRNGKQIGESLTFRPNGALFIRARQIDNEIHKMLYYPSGELSMIMIFRNVVYPLEIYQYSKDGELKYFERTASGAKYYKLPSVSYGVESEDDPDDDWNGYADLDKLPVTGKFDKWNKKIRNEPVEPLCLRSRYVP